jgi:hypothetical protein
MKFTLIKVICFLLLLSSCNNQDKNINNTKPIKKEKKYLPLFLGLSPYMSENDFSTKINELNKNRKLEYGKFPVLIDNEEYLFEIKKQHKSIKLSYTDEYTLTQKGKTTLFFKKYSKEFSNKENKFNTIRNNFIKILSKKYKLNEFQIPSNIELEKIHLECCSSYKIFVDKDKYVIFGTSYYGLKDYLTSSGIKHKESDEDNIFDNMITTHRYGMKILIYYFPINEFKRNFFEEIKLQNYRIKLEKNKQKKKSQNTEEL